MIIPIKCFTCGAVIADKYRFYVNKVRSEKLKSGQSDKTIDKVVYLTRVNIGKTMEGQVLDKLGITNVCCRRHMLTHVDIE